MHILKKHEQKYKVKENVPAKLQKGSFATIFVNYWLPKGTNPSKLI